MRCTNGAANKNILKYSLKKKKCALIAFGWALYLKAYLVNVLQQINDWLMAKSLQKLVLVVTAVGSKEVLERGG